MKDKKIIPIHYKELITVFEHDGFSVQRTKGDHVVMTKEGIKRPLVIKTSPRLVPVSHIRTNMTTAGMTRERYFYLLEKTKR
jgi:predicted RNA binding protein YcfA (HicA-like mRNA interferase family)